MSAIVEIPDIRHGGRAARRMWFAMAITALATAYLFAVGYAAASFLYWWYRTGPLHVTIDQAKRPSMSFVMIPDEEDEKVDPSHAVAVARASRIARSRTIREALDLGGPSQSGESPVLALSRPGTQQRPTRPRQPTPRPSRPTPPKPPAPRAKPTPPTPRRPKAKPTEPAKTRTEKPQPPKPKRPTGPDAYQRVQEEKRQAEAESSLTPRFQLPNQPAPRAVPRRVMGATGRQSERGARMRRTGLMPGADSFAVLKARYPEFIQALHERVRQAILIEQTRAPGTYRRALVRAVFTVDEHGVVTRYRVVRSDPAGLQTEQTITYKVLETLNVLTRGEPLPKPSARMLADPEFREIAFNLYFIP